jgi:hypothetical protein
MQDESAIGLTTCIQRGVVLDVGVDSWLKAELLNQAVPGDVFWEMHLSDTDAQHEAKYEL